MSIAGLRTVTRPQGNNRALIDGTVRPEGFDLHFEHVPVLPQAFRRMVRDLEFDICEMALTTYLCAKAAGTAFTAIPVFLVRGFHHGAIVTGIAEVTPKDLEGQQVGVSRGYTVTTGVWARGVLRDEHGVDLGAVTWAPSADEHVLAYRPPANVEPLPPGQDVAELVEAGELIAAVGITADRSGLRSLIPNPDEAGYAALRTRGHYPINHTIVVRDELLNAHPKLGPALFAAFAESKVRYLEELRGGSLAAPTAMAELYRRVGAITGADPLPYGIEPNRAVLDELIGHAIDQGILAARPAVDHLFAAGTRHLIG